jgi:hypothetical protein
MDIEKINKYLGNKVLINLKNGFQYKIFLSKDLIINDTLSFKGKYNEDVDVLIEDISFITKSGGNLNE